MAKLNFDAQQVDTTQNPYDPLPAGWYVCEARKTDLRLTKNKTGEYVYVDFEVSQGQNHGGRHLFARITTKNEKSEEAVRIGVTQLAELCGAVGLIGLQDTDELLNRPVAVKVKITRSEEYGDDNDCVGFKAASQLAAGGSPMATAQPNGVGGATAAPPAAAQQERPPWAA